MNILPEIWKYKILQYIDEDIYDKLLLVNKQINIYCRTRKTNIIIRLDNESTKFKKLIKRNNIKIILNVSYRHKNIF